MFKIYYYRVSNREVEIALYIYLHVQIYNDKVLILLDVHLFLGIDAVYVSRRLCREI